MHYMQPIIRKITTEDFENGFVETLSAIREVDIPQDRRQAVLEERKAQGWRCYVVVVDSHVIATGSVSYETKFYRGGRKVAHIEDIAVHPDHQGAGYGKMMMTHLKN